MLSDETVGVETAVVGTLELDNTEEVVCVSVDVGVVCSVVSYPTGVCGEAVVAIVRVTRAVLESVV